MRVIHFTQAAADPLTSFGATNASFLPLADGESDTHISCLHLESGAKISSPSLTHSCLLLCVHGSITVTTQSPWTQIDFHAGMGAIVDRNEGYSLNSEEGAILLIVECQELTTHVRAMSTPQRTIGATWPAVRFNA